MRSPKSPAANPRGRQFDRHVSGTGTRGLPKKGGAGGKGVWGAAMDQDGVAYLDKNDPNYDSDQDNNNPPELDLSDQREQPSAPPAPDAAPPAPDAAPVQPAAAQPVPQPLPDQLDQQLASAPADQPAAADAQH